MISRSEFPPRRGESVLVVGGRGFVGSHAVRTLIAAGLRPHLFGPDMADDLLSDISGRFGESHGSIEDRPAIVDAIRASEARCVLTMAAHSVGRQGLMRSGDAEADRALSVNVLGFRNLLEAALQTGIGRIVWTSSTVVYGPRERYADEPVDESALPAPVTFYGLTKALSEDIARYYRDRHALDVVGLRLPLVLGPSLWYQGAASAIAGLLTEAAPGRRHRVSFHDAPLDLMHVQDVARALLIALTRPGWLDAVYNINGFTARLSEIAASVQKQVPDFSVQLDPAEPTMRFPLIDDRRFRRALGFVPEYGLAELVSSMLRQVEVS